MIINWLVGEKRLIITIIKNIKSISSDILNNVDILYNSSNDKLRFNKFYEPR